MVREFHWGMGDEFQRRYTNGTISETLQVRLLQALSDTDLDHWDIDDRRAMKANLEWVTRHRANEGARRRLQTTVIAGVFVIVAAFISWIAPWKTPAPCPAQYICTQTAIPTPSP